LVAVLASVLADGGLSGSGAHLQSAADPFKPVRPPRSCHAGPPTLDLCQRALHRQKHDCRGD
jgi:hypothetical protein